MQRSSVSSVVNWQAMGSLVATLVVVASVLGLSPGAFAQDRPVALTGANVRTVDGGVLEGVTILIVDGKIARIGPGIEVPRFTQEIDVTGRFVTPGLIDGASLLGMNAGGDWSTGASRRAVDAFDRFATAELREAARNGVTAMRLIPGRGSGIRGLSAMVRLESGDAGSRGSVLVEDLDLSINLNSSERASRRLAIFDEVRRSFRDALAYRESLEAYEIQLEDYIEKIEERKKKAEESEGKDGGEGEDKKEEIKKPDAPRPNREFDVLLRAIDKELPVRIEAHRSADILNALELASEFGLALTIEGGAEAHLVASQLAAADAAVILAPLNTGGGESGPRARFGAEAFSILQDAGVSVALSAGLDEGRGTRFVLDNARLASAVEPGTDPVRLSTAGIAELLGVYDEVGSLRPGRFGDVVVWSGDPADPSSVVERVFVGGGLIFMDPSARQREGRGNRRGR
jgi:imidazolonepropionase-like amidohydrolase